MPYRKRTNAKKRAPRRYNHNRRRPLRSNRYKAHRNQITSAVFRTWSPSIIQNLNNTTPQENPNHLAYALTDMNGSLCYVQLFAQYRVRKLRYDFIPITGEKAITESSEATAAYRPLFATAVNRVSSSFPQDMAQIFSMMSCKWTKAGTYHTRYFKPSTFDSVYRAGLATTNALNPEYDQWISTDMANVAQHGLSYVLGQAGDLPTGYYKYRVICTAYCEFKNRRVNTANVSSESKISGA